MVVSFYLAKPMQSSSVVYVPKGGITGIITHLRQNGFQLSSIDPYLVWLMGKPQQGWIDIGRVWLSRGDFLHSLTTSKAALKQVTLIPGETLHFLIKDLADSHGLDPKKLREAYESYAPYPDGVIVPDTYHVPIGIREGHLMYYLVNRSLGTHKRRSERILGVYDENQWFKYVTIASIIEKEAANKQEMPLVSAVIYNRLKKGMHLQMDGTLNYGKYSHQRVTPKRIRTDRSVYNTYKHKGLPPHPVAGVSLEAIKAALSPAEVDYLYFVKNKKGTHTFTNTYKKHLKEVKR